MSKEHLRTRPINTDIGEWTDNARGALNVARILGQGAGASIAGGLVGGTRALLGGDMEDAERARSSVTDALSPGAPSASGIGVLRAAAPAYYGISHAIDKIKPLAQAMMPAMGAAAQYDPLVDKASELAGTYLGPSAAGAVGAAGATLPYAINPEMGEAKDAASVISSNHAVSGIRDFTPLLPDGAHAGTLSREQAANARLAEDGLLPTDPSPSEFAGRQAEHEGAVANRRQAYTKSIEPANDAEADVTWRPQTSWPDDAYAHTARDPVTNELMSRQVVVPRNGGYQSLRMDTDPRYQGMGIGTDLLGDAISAAHMEGKPFMSDTQVSVPAMKAHTKQPGAVGIVNQDHDVISDDTDGLVARSNNGRPLVTYPPAVPADDADMGEMQPGQYIASQAYAEGGAVAGGVAGLGKLMAEYAPEVLKGMPTKATVRGIGTIDVGPNPVARKAAAEYMQSAGIKAPPQMQYAQVDPGRAKAIAQAYEEMQHAPNDPRVAASYEAMKNETMAQYQAMKKAGVNVEFMPPGQDPYAASPRLMAEDVRNNNHMYVYPTSSGFGSAGEDVSGNPLLAQSGENFGGVPATHNDIFRAVHDYFGHAKEGVGFRANGEENAWQQHARMYSDAARPAMTSETRGQNSWVNFGPHGETNQTASGADTVYAPQKTGLLPDWVSQLDDPDQHFLHMSNLDADQVTLDPNKMGSGIKGAEARRGGPKVTALYPWGVDPSNIEQGLESKTPYHVSIPKDQLYDANSDPLNLKADATYNGNLDMSDYESAIKGAGYAGYHVPDATGLLQGQGRLFVKTPAERLGAAPAPAAGDSDLASGFAAGGHVRRFDAGGLAGDAVEGLADLVKKYAPEADTLAGHVAEQGGVTYNPTSGDIHSSGYAVPTEAHRTQVLDSVPDPGDIHQYLMDNQDAFDENPSAALHIVSEPESGFHALSVVHHNPDFGSAMQHARDAGLPGINNVATGENHMVADHPQAPDLDIDPEEPDAADVSEHLGGGPMIQTPWTPGQQTVANPRRNAFPGIYGDPRQVIADASAKVGPEDPLMRQLFGVSRADLSDLALSRQGNELGTLPGLKKNPRGAAAAQSVMTPQNEQRLIDVLGEARNSPSLFQGMTGWYAMDPLYQKFVDIYGKDAAPAAYEKFNTLSGMASPGSDVGTEIARGSAAHWLDTQGRFDDFVRYGGGVEGPEARNAPSDMQDLPGHVYHRTAQAIPMQQYLESGSMQMKSPKVPMYIHASGVPETGFQTDVPVGDAHWARGVGLADTRGDATLKGKPIVPGSSVSTPEMQTLAPWWGDRVAGQAGLDSVPAQALAWGAFSPYTGVKSAIGAPKLEILSTQIGKLANRLGISPEDARDLVISGKAGAFADGGSVGE